MYGINEHISRLGSLVLGLCCWVADETQPWSGLRRGCVDIDPTRALLRMSFFQVHRQADRLRTNEQNSMYVLITFFVLKSKHYKF